jgi:hypothetical protein
MNARVRAADQEHSGSNHMSHELRAVNSPVCQKERSSERVFHRILFLASLLLSVMCVFRRICRDMCRGIELWQRKQSDAENSIIWPPNTRILWMSTNTKNFGKSSAKCLPNRTGQNQPNPVPNRTEPKFRLLPSVIFWTKFNLTSTMWKSPIVVKRICHFLKDVSRRQYFTSQKCAVNLNTAINWQWSFNSWVWKFTE